MACYEIMPKMLIFINAGVSQVHINNEGGDE